jgi:hypothetical protein
MALPEVTAPQNILPKARIDVKTEDVKKVQKFKPGQRVKILLTGTVKEANFRREDSEKEQNVGDLLIEVKEMQMRTSAENDIYELFEDEDL